MLASVHAYVTWSLKMSRELLQCMSYSNVYEDIDFLNFVLFCYILHKNLEIKMKKQYELPFVRNSYG